MDAVLIHRIFIQEMFYGGQPLKVKELLKQGNC